MMGGDPDALTPYGSFRTVYRQYLPGPETPLINGFTEGRYGFFGN